MTRLRLGDTPYEFATAFASWVERLGQGTARDGLLAPIIHEVQELSGLHVLASYSRRSLSPLDRARAIRFWQRARWRLWLACLWRARILRGGR